MKKINKMFIMLSTSFCLFQTPLLANGLGTVNTDNLNVRELNSTNAKVITQLQKDEQLEVYSSYGEWLKVSTNNQIGFVRAEYIDLLAYPGVVSSEFVNVRNVPTTQGNSPVCKLMKNHRITILHKDGDFYCIEMDKLQAYVHSDYISTEFKNIIPVKSSGTSSSQATQPIGSETPFDITIALNNKKVQKVMANNPTLNNQEVVTKGFSIALAGLNYLGAPYIYGGESLTTGIDCSAFTQKILKMNGVSIPRTSLEQSRNGTPVSLDNLQMGDLVFFANDNETVSHVGIYIGSNQMVHSSTESTGVIVGNIYKMGSQKLHSARRY